MVGPPKELPMKGCVAFGQAHHPLRARKEVPYRVNAVHTLPNVTLEQSTKSRSCSPSQDEATSQDDRPESDDTTDDEVAQLGAPHRQRSIASGLEDCTIDLTNIESLHLKAFAGNETSQEQPRAGETLNSIPAPTLKVDNLPSKEHQTAENHSRGSMNSSPVTKSTHHSVQPAGKILG